MKFKMNKEQVFDLLKELDFPKDEFYVLSGASLVIRGIREKCSDLDLCISEDLFNKIKDKYSLTEDKKNTHGFYKINDSVEVVVDKKETFKKEDFNPYNLEDLHTIFEFKIKRNLPKDQADIENINKYLNRNNK